MSKSKKSHKTERLSLAMVPVERKILDQIMAREQLNQSEAIRFLLRWYARVTGIQYNGVRIVENDQ